MIIQNKIIIVGGGLAGLISAIHLAKNGKKVVIFEKNEFPKHKVCGEYISNEVLPYFDFLKLNINELNIKKIDKLSFSLVSGKTINTKLPLGGFGVSRYALDYYLYKKAIDLGCEIIQETVENIVFKDDIFTVKASSTSYESKIVIGAFGKRSNLDISLNRNFIQKKSNWLGVKAHYKLDIPDDLVGLHHFKGGYCGVSKIENDNVNICYLANYESFKKFKTIQEFQNKIVCQNPNMKIIFEKAEIQFEKPLSISQISFDEKKCVENHILMIGDTAGLIHPLCGNGMAMAIHSAKLASETVIDFLENKISRMEMENIYSEKWNHNFKNRLKVGRMLGNLLQKEKLSIFVLKLLIIFSFLLPMIIKKTHGKEI